MEPNNQTRHECSSPYGITPLLGGNVTCHKGINKQIHFRS